MAQPPKGHRKPEARRKTAHLRVRVTASQRATFEAAAEAAELSISEWVVDRLLTAARKETK